MRRSARSQAEPRIRVRLLCWLLLLAGAWTGRAVAQPASSPTPFDLMDRYAAAAPDAVAATPASLAAYLIKPARNPWEKVRVLFRWITDHIDYDMESLLAGAPPSAEPEVVLRRRRAVCAGYSRLFVALCKEAGIEAEYVRGHSREYGEADSALFEKLLGGPVFHAWNVVKLGGQWMPLDVTWGAGHLDGEHHFVRAFDPHYFLTRPVEFIHTHYPLDSKWQLLPQPVDRATYDQLVHVRSGFFRHGLTLQSHRLMNITAQGPVKITLGAPDQVILFASLEQDGKELPDSRTLTLAQRRGLSYEIHASFPRIGTYALRIFSMRKGSEKADRLQWALGYKVQVKSTAKEPSGYPTLFGEFVEHGAAVTAPLRDRIPSNTPQFFSLTVPGAESVYVKTGEQRVNLQPGPGAQFSGSATPQPGDLFLFAVFPGGEQSVGLLKYTAEP